jgi:hypothetical protein
MKVLVLGGDGYLGMSGSSPRCVTSSRHYVGAKGTQVPQYRPNRRRVLICRIWHEVGRPAEGEIRSAGTRADRNPDPLSGFDA